MILSARFLRDVGGVNSFGYVNQIEFTEGDALTVQFQLCDLTKDTAAEGFKPAGRRYMPASGATLSVQVTNLDDSRVVTRACTQPYPTTDPSIWQLTVMATDDIAGTAGLKLTLTEGGVVTRGLVSGAFRVWSPDNV